MYTLAGSMLQVNMCYIGGGTFRLTMELGGGGGAAIVCEQCSAFQTIV